MMEVPIIEINGLVKKYGSLRAVNNLNLSINKGEIFGLLGPNGAGKTTTILMLLGLTEPTSGKMSVCGYDPIMNPIQIKRKVGYMPDSLGFYKDLTAYENLSYTARLNGIKEYKLRDHITNVLDLVGLYKVRENKVVTYSRGMKQRLGLADVLIRNPEVVILDEPTLGIDPSGVQDFLRLIKQLNENRKLTVLLSSHYLYQVQKICDRVGIFVNGSLLAQGDVNSLASELFGTEPNTIKITTDTPVEDFKLIERSLLTLEIVKKVSLLNLNQIIIECKQSCTSTIVRNLVNLNVSICGVEQQNYGLDEIYQRYFENNNSEQARRFIKK
ncbi:ABC transporter ATP-binding protein [Rhizosphaericola mali]|nr:ABC transporter ATP-binding protein [Rhizosphaericola mali]